MNAGASFTPAAGGAVRLGILGCGNMGGAFARGVASHSRLQSAFSLVVHDPGEEATAAMRAIGADVAASPLDLARQSDIVLVAVKPYQVGDALREMREALADPAASKVVLSIAAGVPLEFLRQSVDGACPVVRVMPNTLVAVADGVYALCFDTEGRGRTEISAAWRERVRLLLGSLGRVLELDESKMNAFTALAGSGPAYVFHFMDSLAEAGVSAGLSREDSKAIALSLVRGCAALAEGGTHPVVLREQVSSPGGTTVAALNHLDRTGVRGHLIDAVLAAYRRGKEMEGEN
jgi:pyrroline-5-carboxylate reductase